MKRFFTFFLALLTMVGVANAAAVAPVSGELEAGVEYTIPGTGNSFDEYYTCSETLSAGQTIVVFYYTHSSDMLISTPPIYFGTGGKNPLSTKKTEEDAAGNKVGRLVANASTLLNSDGHPVIELYKPDDANATWCYVICSEDEAATIAMPEFGAANVGPIAPVSGSLIEKTEYTIPGTGNSFDEYYTCSETLSAGQTIVVFYYTHSSDMLISTPPIYFGTGGKNPLSTKKTEEDAAGNKVGRLVANASTLLNSDGHPVIELYKPDDANATWCYVICTEDEAATVAIPEFGTGGGTTPVVDLDGQTEEKAFTLTQTATSITSPKSKTSTTEYVIYAKFEAAADGTAKVTMPEGETNGKYLKKPGDASYKTYNFDNSFEVVKGQTYYIWYRYKSEVTGEAKYTLTEAGAGESRGAAILLEANGGHNLLGVPSVEVEGGKNYTNTTTWFKIAKDGALKANNLVTVTIGGDNTTEVALYQNDEATPIKTYAMGDGSGMLAKNSTVKLDIDLAQNDYYLGITQDDVNGTASFTFSEAQPGETIAHAFPAAAGSNAVTTAGWYKYTHDGDRKLIKVSGISRIVNEEGGLVAEGDDVKVGFVITNGTSIYFEASGNFTITLDDVEKGMTADDPVIIDDQHGATFNLSGAATDTQRFMQYSATEDGTFIYATQNASVLDYAVSATVRDVTNAETPKPVSIVQEQSAEFGEPYFIYKWPVVANHVYLIEQSLGNNFGTVEFFTMFTPAEAGETIGKAFPIALYEAKDLGRQATTPKYYKFTAAEAGDYTVSVQLTGYVKSYDADGNATTIQKSYSDGLVYHNETFTLAEGESLVFSCEPSETIEHVAGGVNDAFIPNYYATVTKADETGGLDYNHPESITENDNITLDANNVWYGPITVPADTRLYVKATLNEATETSAVYFAVQTATSGLQWINKDVDLSVEIDGKTQIFTINTSTEERQINLMGYGMMCAGTFSYSFTDPSTTHADPLTFYVEPDFAYNADENKLTVSFTVPQTYKDSETAVANLNLAAVSLKNETTGQSMQISTSTGEGAYNAGETFSITNTVSFDINDGDVLSVALQTWGQSNITIETKPFTYSSLDEDAYYIVITNGETQQKIKVSADVKLEWKKGSELKK